MPTILKAAGVAVPEGLAGRPLQPLFEAAPAKAWREYLFTEGNFHTANMYLPQRTVRDDRFKLLLNLAAEFRPGCRRAVRPAGRSWRDKEPRDRCQLSPNSANDLKLHCRSGRSRRTIPCWMRHVVSDGARLRNNGRNRRRGLDRGPYPDVARVPPGGLKLLD